MRIFVIGVGPLPFYQTGHPMTALSDGTWQVILPLLEDGHTVRAVTMEYRKDSIDSTKYLQKPEEISPQFEHQCYPEATRTTKARIARRVQQSLASFQPDAVISAGTPIASSIAVELIHRKPIWYDLKGAYTPELQLRLDAPNPEDFLETYPVYKKMLLRGDRFSAVTPPQMHMVMGELGLLGRLNYANLNDPLVSVKRTGLVPNSPPRQPPSGRIRGRLCGNEDFVLFSSGSFNTWQDTKTMFATIDSVLSANPNTCFVCIGGELGGFHSYKYQQFQSWCEQSPCRERIHLQGWVPQDEVIEYESEADLGINFDLDVPESHYGDRSRFLSWIARGVGIATTPIPEPSQFLVERKMALALVPGNAEQSARNILDLISHRDVLAEMTNSAEKFVRTEWTYQATTDKLRQWAENPRFAGDNREWFESGQIGLHRELASCELVLDNAFTGPQRRENGSRWKKTEKWLYNEWPWPDGKRKW